MVHSVALQSTPLSQASVPEQRIRQVGPEQDTGDRSHAPVPLQSISQAPAPVQLTGPPEQAPGPRQSIVHTQLAGQSSVAPAAQRSLLQSTRQVDISRSHALQPVGHPPPSMT